MVDLAIELKDNSKLSGSNFLEWKMKISAILQLKHLLKLVNNTETEEEAAKRNLADPDRHEDALAILILNCDSKISARFSHESKGDPKVFWKLLDEYYQPKTVQNQATYLNRIFSTIIASNNLETTLNSISDNCRLLCSIIDDKMTTPSELLDSVIAMWVLFNLPSEFVPTGELLLKKCQIEKKPLTLKALVEDVRNYLQRNNEGLESNKALAAFRKQERKPYDGPRCSPGYHNPKTFHRESDCSFLKRSFSSDDKPTKALHVSQSGRFSEIILDSGATTSMFNSVDFFPTLEKSAESIFLADGSQISASGYGTARLDFPHAIVTLKNSLFVPGLKSNLISLSTFIKNGYSLTTDGESRFKLCDNEESRVITGSLACGNFIVDTDHQANQVTLKSDVSLLNVRHQAAGHPSMEYFYKMFPSLPRTPFACSTCDVSKRHKEPFPGHFPPATRKLDYLHIDLCGPISPPSESGFRYFLRAVDGYSHFVWVRFMAFKSNVNDIIQNLFTFIENESGEKICHLVTDNGTEFKNNSLNSYYSSKGIAHLTTAPYHPENNPFAERGNRTTVEKARCLLKDSGLELSFWAEAVNCSVHLENLSPSKSINFSSPFEMWFGRTPNLTYLHPFGCQAVFLINRSAGKFRSRGAVGIFLGYGDGHRSFRVLERETGKVVITHHVKFNDHIFPACENGNSLHMAEIDELFYSNVSSSSSLSSPPQIIDPSTTTHEDDNLPQISEIDDEPISSDQSYSEDEINRLLTSNNPREESPDPSGEDDSVLDESHPSSKYYTWTTEDASPSQEIRGDIDPANIMESRRRPHHSAHSAIQPPEHLAYSVILSPDDPKTYHQAVSSPDSNHWESAIETELGNMQRLKVWSTAPPSKEIRPLTTTWVFKRKTDQDGNLTKYKARLCVRGFSQREGIDYSDVFSPTGRLTSLRIMLTLCALNQFEVHQMDVRCAFLNGTPEEDLYVYAPLGLKAPPKTVLRLHKALYGLKQSPRCWHKALTAALRSIGLRPTYSDPCLYVSEDQSRPFFLFVHVDDLLFGGSWTSEFKERISEIFEMEDLGVAKYALGIRINQLGSTISLVQDKYIKNILDEFQIRNDRSTGIPLPSDWKQIKTFPSEKPAIPPFNYRRAVGLIQWIVQCTRPDLAFALSFLSQFLEDPRESHYKAVRHTLRYLISTKDQQLVLGQNDLNHKPIELLAFSDSDWNGSKAWNSYSASVIYFHGTVGWRSHKQQSVALSSAEGEYVSLSECSQDLLWCKNVLDELRHSPKLKLFSDNQSAIAIASNPIYHHGTRHINFKYHFVRDHVESKLITLQYLQTDKMQADLLTKNLTEGKTTIHRSKLLGQQSTLSRE